MQNIILRKLDIQKRLSSLKSLWFLVLLLISFENKGQNSLNFPVDCRVLLSPPYTGKFTDITNSPTKFRVQLLLKDLTKSSIDISLRIRLKGQGVWLENPEGFITSKPITLTPGVPKTFSALELAEYFAPQNIEAQGIDYAQLLNGLPLPFGFYEWEVVAIELYRNREVSNVGRGKFYIQNNYPPLLNMPRDESIVPATFPQNLLFSWTPRHITPALGTGGLLYHLYLYEIPEDNTSISSAADIQALINSGTPYMQELLSDKPYYNYGASNLPLTAGKRYAWQVRVESFGENDGFLNDGYSDIKSFVYGHLPCPRPTNLQAKVDADDGSVALTWDAPSDALSFKVAYNAQPSGIKTERSILEKNYLLIQQPRGFTYAWQVQSVCQQGQSEPSKETFELNEAPQDSAWISDPNLTYTPKQDPKPDPDVLQTTDDEGINDTTETSPEENLDEILNTSTKIYIPAEGKELPEGVPSSLTTLPANATVEQLQEVLKSKKPNCAGISASYSCGNHDSVPQYSGSIVSVAAGDEIAMNSMVLSVVSIDGSGNGEGLIKVPMMNNIKLGVTLSGIQVAEGGCVVAGRAELSGVSASVLTDKQRATLEKVYTAYNQVLDLAYENAGAIAETYNSLTELYEKIAQKTQAILDKVNDGKKISKAEQKALAEMKKKAKEGIDKQIAYFTKKFGSGGSDEIINLVNLASQSCTCEAYTETSEPKKGPKADAGEWIFYDDNCKKCLEDDKKRQQEMAKLAKALEEKLKAIKGKKMECGCFKWGTILKDLGTDDKDCEEIAAKMNQMREYLKSSLYANIEVLEKLEGQVMIGENCIDKFSLEISNNASMDVTSIPRDEYNEPNREINSNRIELYNDRTKYPQRYLTIKTDNNNQAKLVEKWLFDGVKEGVDNNNNNDINNESDRLGTLSAKYESGSNGVGTISTGKGDHGGMSYGLYQFASKNSSIADYIDSPEFSKWKKLFSGLTPTTSNFNKAWEKLAKDEPNAFRKSQHEYIYRTHYLVLKENNKNLINLDKYSDVLKDVCWSTAVHHGKDTGVLKRALKDKDISKLSEKDIITAIYEERGKKDKNGELAYFHSSSKNMQDGIEKRFKSELNDALSRLNN
jgi:hypothetical protein